MAWTIYHTCCSIFTVQGIFTALLNLPLVIVLITKPQYRDRKEFILIVGLCMSDLFYILGYNWSNIRFILSYGYEIGVTTRGDCSGRVIAWVNIIAAQLVGEMTLITAVDRVIATCRPFWHYARTPRYSVLLCLVPLVLCTCTAIVNYILVQTSDAKDQEVTVMCFSFMATYPGIRTVFNFHKWACIAIAALLYATIALYLHLCQLKTRTQRNLVSDAEKRRFNKANKIMGLTTLNSLLFLLVPDVVSNYTGYGNIPVFLITTSIMLNKITFNFVLFMAYHKELRRIYVAIFYLFTASRSHTDRVITL